MVDLSIVMCMSYQRVQETVWIFLAHPPKTSPIYAPNDVDIPYSTVLSKGVFNIRGMGLVLSCGKYQSYQYIYIDMYRDIIEK